MRRLVPLLWLALSSACVVPAARQKMSFDELYSDPAPYPTGDEAPSASVRSAPPSRLTAEGDGLDSPELRQALEHFVTLARATRQDVVQGSPMPDAQVVNWREINTWLDVFLRAPVPRTSSLDVVRTRTTLESELELDARLYGDIPADLADAVLARMDALATRMAELRRLQARAARRSTSLQSNRFAWPVDPVVVTSVFGSRLHPILGTERDHQGLDLAAKAGQLVTASSPGVVLRAGPAGGHGNQVILQHDGDITTRYSHLSRVLVVVGDVVEQGDVVGAAGRTGLATGVHLHFELWKDGVPVDPLDELGPTDSGEEPAFVQRVAPVGPYMTQGRRP
ncbi:M23 family metallopeptidase [Archangium primigenium]|uniref:M23 family metallopeptidase n=1 Tax=[Archangium] primigenium TaxID=2792470 RepID=UPI001EF96BBB|nr:M23 family metallopeptidase [Archangium primigenium]